MLTSHSLNARQRTRIVSMVLQGLLSKSVPKSGASLLDSASIAFLLHILKYVLVQASNPPAAWLINSVDALLKVSKHVMWLNERTINDWQHGIYCMHGDVLGTLAAFWQCCNVHNAYAINSTLIWHDPPSCHTIVSFDCKIKTQMKYFVVMKQSVQGEDEVSGAASREPLYVAWLKTMASVSEPSQAKARCDLHQPCL